MLARDSIRRAGLGILGLAPAVLAACAARPGGAESAVPAGAGMVARPAACRVTGAWTPAGAPTAAPAVQRCVLPRYPDALRMAGREGTVVVRLAVDSAGVPDPATVRVTESAAPALAGAVRRAAPYVRFAAAAAGESRPVVVELPFDFTLGP